VVPYMRGEAFRVHSRTPGDPELLGEVARSLASAIASS